MRSIDWSTTALGPVEDWPQSLLTSVSTCLNSRFPILIWWGPDLVKIYNDAYRPMLGDKHPRSMGQRGRDVWPEIWHIIGPMLEGVLYEGRATWSENQLLLLERHRFVEECYFTYSYSPIRDESGGIGGVYCAVTETTRQILGERRLRTLRNLATHTADVTNVEDVCRRIAGVLADARADVPFALFYLVDVAGAVARLVASSRIEPGREASPTSVSLAGDGDGWPLAAAMEGGTVQPVGDLPRRFTRVIDEEPQPRAAVVLPLVVPGDARPSALLVAGLSPRLAYDSEYQTFVTLMQGHVTSAIAAARALDEARRRADELAELDRAKTVFFSNVSHEFRTPLTLMLGPIEDATGQPDGSLSGETLRAVHRNTLRLLKLVNTLLDFSRIEAGRIQASYQPTALEVLTADLASAFRSAMERAGLRYTIDCEALPEPIFVDRDMWEKIVLNILSNAFKFTIEGAVTVRLRWTGSAAQLEVIDTGSGIAAKDLPRVFDRFYRVPGVRARTQEGTGIGMALVHELVQLHGGTIGVDSRLGEGTTVRVTIPAGSAHLPADRVGAGPTLEPTALGAAPFVEEALRWLPEAPDAVLSHRADTSSLSPLEDEAGGPGRILVADDNADMRDYLRRLLSPRWEIRVVPDGEAAWAALIDEPHDLVITDVMMPRLDGFGLLRRLRSDERTKDLPVIILSARAGEEARIEGITAGASDYLVKPFSARELLARVGAHVALARMRQRAEAEHAARIEASERLEAALAGADIGTYFWDMRTNLVRHDEGVERLLGLPARREHSLVAYTACIHPDDRPGWLEAARRCAEEGADFELEYRVIADGRERWILDRARMHRDAEGRPTYLSGAIVDVSERKFAEEAAREANYRKDEFLALLGHELRNPLAPILTALQLMQLRGGDGGTEREREVIERQVKHLARLVDDLLDVSRVIRGKVELEREQVEASTVVIKAIEMASPLIDQRKHRLSVEVPAKGLLVDVDTTRMAQVVCNLLTNAAKYTPEGGRIAVRAARRGDQVTVQVADTGVGIEHHLLPRIFEMFVQGPRSLDRSEGGLGLGLPLVHSLMRLHGGSVEADSEGLGRGSTFTIVLPGVTRASRAGVAPAKVSSSPPSLAGNGQKILVVDDNADAADMLAEMLRALGHDVAVAYDGPQALEAAETFQPTVAFIDIGLPVMDGYDVARRLRQRPEGPRLRLVALTGYGLESDKARSRAAGFDAHLVKPVGIRTLVEAIEPPGAEASPASP